MKRLELGLTDIERNQREANRRLMNVARALAAIFVAACILSGIAQHFGY